MKKFIAGMLVGAVISGGSAVAGRMVTSKDIKNGTLKTIDLSAPLEMDTTIAGVFSGTSPGGTGEELWSPPSGQGGSSQRQGSEMIVPAVSLGFTQLTVEWQGGTNDWDSLDPGDTLHV